jgi:virginiamycin B lyase
MWFTETSAIGRITASGAITQYEVAFGSGLSGITLGPDGALWFTETAANKIGRITTSGMVSQYPLPYPNSDPNGIAVGPDGALWFTEYGAARVGRITTGGVITEYFLPAGNNESGWITTGPDGALWFTVTGANNIGRISTEGVISLYPVPTANSGPFGITPAPDDTLWFTELTGNKIGRITTAGAITEFALPFAGSGPGFITSGFDGELWITENAGNRIGEAFFVSASLTASPASGFYQTSLSFTGSGFAPNEGIQIYLSGVGSAVLAQATADPSGAFMVSAPAPQSNYGPRLFVGVGQNSGKLGAADFSARPLLIMNPNSGPLGSTAVAQGFGFGPSETVNVYWEQPYTFLGTATTNVHGTFNGKTAVPFIVPTGAAPGANEVSGTGQITRAVGAGTFTVQ